MTRFCSWSSRPRTQRSHGGSSTARRKRGALRSPLSNARAPWPHRPARRRRSSHASRAHTQRTLVLACVDAMQANEPEVILPLVEEMTRVAAGAGIEASLQASLRRGSALTHLGRLAEAEEQLGAAWQEARRAFLPGIALDIGSWLAQTRYMRGRLIEAQEVADECESLAERIGEPSRPAMLARMWRLIATISGGDHRAALAGLQALCEAERDPHHRIPLHQAIARWHSRLGGAASADEVHARIAAGRRDVADARCTRCGLEFIRAATESLARIGAVAEAMRWFEEAEHSPPRGDLQAWDHLRARSALAAAGRGDRASLQDAIDTADRLGMGIESIWARTSLALRESGRGRHGWSGDDPVARLGDRRGDWGPRRSGRISTSSCANWASARGDAERAQGRPVTSPS